jgi:X-Pro dipeptidyl-peptidase
MIGTDADTLFDNILSRQYPEACASTRARVVRGADRETGDYNAFWDERNYVKDVAKFKTAVLISHGLNDFNVKPRHAGRLWEALRPTTFPRRFGGIRVATAIARIRARPNGGHANRFWTRTSLVSPTRRTGPAVVERKNAGSIRIGPCRAPGGAVRSGAVANGRPLAGPHRSSSRRSVDDSSSAPVDCRPGVTSRLCISAPLPRRSRLGTPSVGCVRQARGQLSAMLVDYKAAGAPFIVTRGWADPQNRESISKTTPVVPGTAYTMTFELQPHDYVFAAGSRLGLVLLSSDRLFTLRPPPGTRLTVHTAESSLLLPVVGGDAAFRAATAVR